jgi:CobQ-like glutamine amidotransferase family enzyme
MNKQKLTIGYLYPEYMNIYGDTGNIITLEYRMSKRNIDCIIKPITKDFSLLPGDIDIYFFGGGQDLQQVFVSNDIKKYSSVIKQDIEAGAVALTICGGYQLFGRFYRPFKSEDLPGINIFKAETHASQKRMINNLAIEMHENLHENISKIYKSQIEFPKTLIGFENHSGQTFLDTECSELGTTIKGYGNNELHHTEGAWYKNAFGTYMHGSLLPKNPHFADYLISQALKYRYQTEILLEPLDDSLEYQAHKAVLAKILQEKTE